MTTIHASDGNRKPAPGRWLQVYAWITVLATCSLIFVGAMVTTKDYGLAVPDWPTSFGTFNPPGWWHMEGVNWEHGHRLLGAAIGLLVIGLAIGMWRTFRNSPLKWLGIAALVAVCIQGLFGGLRVTEVSTTLAIVHGCFAQAFFGLLVAIAVLSNPDPTQRLYTDETVKLKRLRMASVIFLATVFIQLIIGATMRHYKAGLAIPDFPLAMGEIIPPIGSFAVAIHFAHRVWAIFVLAAAGFLIASVWSTSFHQKSMNASAMALAILLGVQILLGATIIWQLRAAIPTCLHVMNGAAILALGVFFLVRSTLFIPRGDLIAEKKVMESNSLTSEELA